MANKPAPDAKAPEPSPSTEAATWTAVAAGVGGLVALVLAKKGANAASPPVEEPFRPANVIPSEIWAQQQAVPETTGNAWLDQNLGYPGTIKPRRRWFA